MTGVGMKKGVDGISSSGDSYFDSREGYEWFPGVPYNRDDLNDFRCDHNIEGSDYTHSAEHVSLLKSRYGPTKYSGLLLHSLNIKNKLTKQYTLQKPLGDTV